MIAVTVIVCAVILVGIGVFLVKKYEKNRTLGLTEFFGTISFSNFDTGIIPSFKITTKGHSRKRFNNFQGTVNDLDLSVFDYRYSTGGGKNKQTYTFTIVMTDANLPVFQLSKEGIFQKIADKFTNKDIDFQSHPTFSEKYVLKADNEQAVREIFTPEVLDFFEDNQRYHNERYYVESNSNQLIFAKLHKRIKPENMNEFLEKAKQCFNCLSKPI
ncbi:MAG: hypothetical protein KAS23_07045 [Anaerohalosphaera sp.]|nr:hypothetical protein [Anaerohalosphaera sp.]